MNTVAEHLHDEGALVRACIELGAADVGGPLSKEERALLRAARCQPSAPRSVLARLRREIRDGQDPLGDIFCSIRSGELRRQAGAFYTKRSIVEPMVRWIVDTRVDRVIDPGCGSGRFVIAALEQQRKIDAIAIDLDPLATLMTRGNIAVRKMHSVRVVQADFTLLRLPKVTGRTGFVGNPPYVRHHDLDAATKRRGTDMARTLGHAFSQLAGLHAHFFLATAINANKGDVGAFITAAEWLDVGYGSIIRDLMLNGLGGRGVHVIQPNATAFDDAMTTAAIAYFQAGAEPSELRLSLAKTARFTRLGAAGRLVPRQTLLSSPRWSPIVKAASPIKIQGVSFVAPQRRLGELVKVSRGQVTGANQFFVMPKTRARDLGIEDVCVPAITAAEEILNSDGRIYDSEQRYVVIDPAHEVRREQHVALDEYLKSGEVALDEGALPICKRYICAHRNPWWSVRARKPPIVMTYMARQAPRFALNVDRLALLNVGHALYPRVPLSNEQLQALVEALNRARQTFRGCGRTYHGGLEKFEPREVENLPLPPELDEFLSAT